MTKRRKLRFSIIANFIYEVDLDFIPLDICGIVLGSPYLYDWIAIFHRHENNSIICSKIELSTLLEKIKRS